MDGSQEGAEEVLGLVDVLVEVSKLVLQPEQGK